MTEIFSNTHPYLRPRKMNDMRRRWLTLALLLAFLFHAVIFLLASNYRVLSLLPYSQPANRTKEFVVTSIPSRLEQTTASNPAGEKPEASPGSRITNSASARSFERAFNAPQPRIAPPSPTIPLAPTDLNIAPVVSQPSLLRITDDGLVPVGSLPSASASPVVSPTATTVALPPSDFDLPSAIPGTLASEDISSLEGTGRGLGGIRTDDLPGLDELARLFDPSKVQALETPQGIMLRMSNEVLFEFNSAELAPDAIPVLKEVVQLLRRYAGAQVSIEGHTDTIGSADFNQKLSEQRAQTVAKWLTSQPAMVFRSPPQIIGYGESRPIVNPLGNRDEQHPNRRVEIHIRAEKRPD